MQTFGKGTADTSAHSASLVWQGGRKEVREKTAGLIWFPLLMVALPWMDKGRMHLVFKGTVFPVSGSAEISRNQHYLAATAE